MNFLCSYNWLKDITNTKLSPKKVAEALSLHGPTVEHVHNVSEKFEKMVVGRVVKLKKHPNSNKLKVAITDIGSKELNIVCGGKNLYEDMRVAVALPGAQINFHGEGDIIEVGEVDIRGVKSEGAICAAEEIGLETMFEEDKQLITDLSHLTARPGTSLAKALGLNDYLFDIEVTSNRVDLMGMEGVGRELSAITKQKSVEIKTPKIPDCTDEKAKPLLVSVEDRKLCPRYQAVRIKGIKVEPSPSWMQARLMLGGIRPINNVVDISNYVLLEMGQPLHAFDGKKVKEINVRYARDGERLKALDGNTYNLESSMLVIADNKRPIAIAGVMGGGRTGITEKSVSVVWEAANFDHVSVRRTARKLLLFSESQTRFEKGLSVYNTQRALERAVELTLEIAGGHVSSEVVDIGRSYKSLSFPFDPKEFDRLLGFDLSLSEARGSLERLGFEIRGSRHWTVTVPWWRDKDIEHSVDFVEEAARLYGYHDVECTIPRGISDLSESDEFPIITSLQNILTGKGFSEMISYAMIGREDVTRLGYPLGQTMRIDNPLSAEWEYLRPSLLPSLLIAVRKNLSFTDCGRLFETAHVYEPRAMGGGLPDQDRHVIFGSWGQSEKGELFYEIKGVLEEISSSIGFPIRLEAFDSDEAMHPGRNAHVYVGNKRIGIIGEVHPSVCDEFCIENRVGFCEINLKGLEEYLNAPRAFIALPEYPGVKRDMAFFVDSKTQYSDVMKCMTNADSLVTGVELFDIYQGKGVPDNKKSMAFHITYRSNHKTLSMEEADEAHKKVENSLVKYCKAQVRK